MPELPRHESELVGAAHATRDAHALRVCGATNMPSMSATAASWSCQISNTLSRMSVRALSWYYGSGVIAHRMHATGPADCNTTTPSSAHETQFRRRIHDHNNKRHGGRQTLRQQPMARQCNVSRRMAKQPRQESVCVGAAPFALARTPVLCATHCLHMQPACEQCIRANQIDSQDTHILTCTPAHAKVFAARVSVYWRRGMRDVSDAGCWQREYAAALQHHEQDRSVAVSWP